MISKIPPGILEFYKPLSLWECFYLRTRWRLCPFEKIESLVPRKGKILDLGCGYGLLANLLAARHPGRSVTGLDLNATRIDVARRSAVGRRNITFYHADLEDIAESRFDVIIMTDVLHHIPREKSGRLLSIAVSRLQASGRLIILDVDRVPAWKHYAARTIDRLLNPGAPLYYRSREEMRQLLERFSLQVEMTIPSHRGLPLSDIIYVCRKNPPS